MLKEMKKDFFKCVIFSLLTIPFSYWYNKKTTPAQYNKTVDDLGTLTCAIGLFLLRSKIFRFFAWLGLIGATVIRISRILNGFATNYDLGVMLDNEDKTETFHHDVEGEIVSAVDKLKNHLETIEEILSDGKRLVCPECDGFGKFPITGMCETCNGEGFIILEPDDQE